MRYLLLLYGLILGLSLTPVHAPRAQALEYSVQYRPPGVRYDVFDTPHFTVIYQRGTLRDARRLAGILERSLDETAGLIGSDRLRRMPIVLNAYNDRSNGFVTAFPFKQEIEATAIKGSTLSPHHPSWFDVVGPHELAHAVHAEYGRGFGIGAIVRPLAPDVARSFNLLIPPGVTEGIAVYRESRMTPGAGRLNHSQFVMKFRASLGARSPWSLAQLVERPAYTYPFDRYYIGGSHFVAYLLDGSYPGFFRRAASLNYRVPFLGYGIGLWVGTRTFPTKVYRSFLRSEREREAARLARLTPLGDPEPVAAGTGIRYRRPRWIHADTLLVYGEGYSLTPGFYRIDARTGAREHMATGDLTEDLFYSLDPHTGRLLYARYVVDPLGAPRSVSDLFTLDPITGDERRITRGERLFAPVRVGDVLWAVQNDGPHARLGRVDSAGAFVPFHTTDGVQIKQLAPDPFGTGAIVLLNMRGHQGLFYAAPGDSGVIWTPWLLFEDGAVYDMAWGPEGRYLVFSADPGGVSDVYAYDRRTDRLFRLTRVPYGALEPALSPDGRTVAFVEYRHERYSVMRIPFEPAAGEAVDRAAAGTWDRLPWKVWLEGAPEVSEQAPDTTRPYRAIRYVRPRMVYPIVRGNGGGDYDPDGALGLGGGLAVQGSDPLEQWAYGLRGFYQAGRLWGGITIQTARSVLRPFLRLYDEPTSLRVRLVDAGGNDTVVDAGREDRGAEFSVSLPVTLASNVRLSGLVLSLSGTVEQQRFFLRDEGELAPFRRHATLSPGLYAVFGQQANARDLVPNRGLIVQLGAEIDLASVGRPEDRAAFARVYTFLPLRARNSGLRLDVGVLTQNQGGIYNLERFLPRGYESDFLGRGSYVRYGVEYTQPLWYIDDGLLLLPIYLKALFAYGFAEALRSFGDPDTPGRISSAGAGIGIQIRFWHFFDFEFRYGFAFRRTDRRWVGVNR